MQLLVNSLCKASASKRCKLACLLCSDTDRQRLLQLLALPLLLKLSVLPVLLLDGAFVYVLVDLQFRVVVAACARASCALVALSA
jgi:hypothetical protein